MPHVFHLPDFEPLWIPTKVITICLSLNNHVSMNIHSQAFKLFNQTLLFCVTTCQNISLHYLYVLFNKLFEMCLVGNVFDVSRR